MSSSEYVIDGNLSRLTWNPDNPLFYKEQESLSAFFISGAEPLFL